MASKHTQDLDYELKLVQALCWSRSFETETVLIHVNPGGDRKEGGFMGGSGVWAPLKGKIGGYEREEVGLQFVDVDLGVLKVRHCFIVRLIRNKAKWCRMEGSCTRFEMMPISGPEMLGVEMAVKATPIEVNTGSGLLRQMTYSYRIHLCEHAIQRM